MLFFEVECDEDQVRRYIKLLIDEYEQHLREHGNYQIAVEAIQENAIHALQNNSQAIEEFIEHKGILH